MSSPANIPPMLFFDDSNMLNAAINPSNTHIRTGKKYRYTVFLKSNKP